jgi:hypothetical protein
VYVQVHEDRERIFDEGFESRSSCAEVFFMCIAGAIGRRACFKRKMFSVRIGGDAPHLRPRGANGRHGELKPRAHARSNRSGDTTLPA